MMRRFVVRLAGDAGSTLVEVLAAVALMGIAFVTILGGMSTSAIGSDIGAKKALAEATARSYTELIIAAPYVDCAGEAVYSVASVGLDVPAGFSATVDDVRYWDADPDPSTGSFRGSCSTDEGLQEITVVVAADDERAAVSRAVLKRTP